MHLQLKYELIRDAIAVYICLNYLWSLESTSELKTSNAAALSCLALIVICTNIKPLKTHELVWFMLA